MHPLLRAVESRKAWLLETLEALVRLESPSTEKAAVDRCGSYVAARLTELGAKLDVIAQSDAGDHLRALFPGDGPQLMMLGHFDTVWEVGRIEQMPLRQENGRLYGPGVYDMKAGIASLMLALRTLTELRMPHPPIVILLTTDEEIGSRTSRALIEAEARRSCAVLVLEPSLPGGGAKTSRKGVGEFTLTVRGVSAHAGLAPEQGVNAVHELAHQIVALQRLQDLARGITVNATVVEGGTRTNVIPDRARAQIDVRVPTLVDAVRIEQAIRSLAPVMGARLDIAGGVERPPLERTTAVAELYETARRCAGELGKTLREGPAGGGSDGNFTGAIGVPTLDGLGPDGDGAHARHEHVVIDDVAWRGALLACLASRLGFRGGWDSGEPR